MTDFSERIKQCRKTIGLTQKQAAAILGIKERQWQRYEAGESVPGFDGLQKIAGFFSVSIDYLIGNASYFSDAQGNAIFLDPDDELAEAHRTHQDPEVFGVRLTPGDIILAAKTRDEVWNSYPILKDLWKLIMGLQDADPELRNLISKAKISETQAKNIAAKIREILGL